MVEVLRVGKLPHYNGYNLRSVVPMTFACPLPLVWRPALTRCLASTLYTLNPYYISNIILFPIHREPRKETSKR